MALMLPPLCSLYISTTCDINLSVNGYFGKCRHVNTIVLSFLFFCLSIPPLYSASNGHTTSHPALSVGRVAFRGNIHCTNYYLQTSI